MAGLIGHLISQEAGWTLPDYAQPMLWLRGDADPVRVSGPRGAFELDVPENGEGTIDLAWGVPNGPLLARWPVTLSDDAVVLGWRGMIGVGGFVERLHAFEVRGIELVVAEIEGALLPPRYRHLPTLEQMRRAVFERDDVAEAPDTPEFIYTLIAMADSIHAEYLHHSMVSELAVDVRASLGPQAGRWHEVVGLPLLIESVSLLASG